MPSSHPLLVQLARVWRLSGRWLPNGWLDAIRQLALFAGAYYLYRIVRGIVDGQAGLAFENARHLVDAERALGLFFEPSLQAWAEGREWIITLSSWMYVNSHFVITTTFLIWLYIARNHAYYFVRNMFMVAMSLALVGYMAYPTAPPRFLPEWGFSDSVASFVGENAEQSANVLYNPFAAVPSMHVAFALMIAVPAIMLVKRQRVQGAVGDLPLRRHLRRDGHGQPLLARRRAGRARGRHVRVRRLRRVRACPPGGLGVAHRQSMTIRTGAEMRELARNRLIESRLTPNAISVTGLIGNLIAAVLILEHYFVLAGVAFILGSLCDMFDGRYSRMSGKGTPFGAFLDSTLDRVEEGIVLAAVAAWFAESSQRVRGGCHGGGRGGLLHGQLHACARGGARRGMQGGDSFARRPGSNPFSGAGVRSGGADSGPGPA